MSVALLLGLSFALQDAPPPTMASVMEAATPQDWADFDPENTLYMDVGGERVVMVLSPEFAPGHTANVKALVREGYYDGLSIFRVQENYVVQWGDVDETRPVKVGKLQIPAEFTQDKADGIAFTPLPDGDGYAHEVGFSGPFHAARSEDGKAWLTHCPTAIGMARDVDPDTGGAQLYTVIGHAPRHLDRNTTVFGRIVWGIEHLSTLPRGTGPLGFYENKEQRVPISRVRVAADVPTDERLNLQYMRSDTKTFEQLVESRRNRREDWYHYAAGHVELCNVPIPVRERP